MMNALAAKTGSRPEAMVDNVPDERREQPHEADTAERMLGALPGVPALGRGPAPKGDYSRHEYHHPAAGWGAARGVGHVLERAGEPLEGFRALFVMNHEDGGFDCPGARGRTTRADCAGYLSPST